MFRTISITGFIIVFSGVILHCLVTRFAGPLTPSKSIRRKGLLRLIDVLTLPAYVAALICCDTLIITGFVPALFFEKPISGYWLMVHVSVGGVFSACLAFLVLTRAHRNRFKAADCPKLQNILNQENEFQRTNSAYFILAKKICFWLIALLALPVLMSIVLSMFPIFGTDMQHLLMQLHRYSALALALTAVIHTYLIMTIKMKN